MPLFIPFLVSRKGQKQAEPVQTAALWDISAALLRLSHGSGKVLLSAVAFCGDLLQGNQLTHRLLHCAIMSTEEQAIWQ